MHLDAKKILEQEPDFAAYVKDVLYESMTKSGLDLITVIYAMYSSGMSKEQTIATLVMMLRFNK